MTAAPRPGADRAAENAGILRSVRKTLAAYRVAETGAGNFAVWEMAEGAPVELISAHATEGEAAAAFLFLAVRNYLDSG